MSKYHAKRTAGPNGKMYASKKEAHRAWELHTLQNSGLIYGLIEQVSFELLPATEMPGCKQPLCYVADFQYIEISKIDNGEHMYGLVVEDVKGFRTPVYLLKKRLMRQLLGITITEV